MKLNLVYSTNTAICPCNYVYLLKKYQAKNMQSSFSGLLYSFHLINVTRVERMLVKKAHHLG
jgi:hypothetical protein